MRSIDRRQLLVVVVALMCLTALPGSTAAAGGGDVRMPSNHTDFGTDNEADPAVLENFSVAGSGDSAILSGPVGGTTKGGGLVSSGDTISWSESSPSTSDSVINVTGINNTKQNDISGTVSSNSTRDISVGGTADPSGPNGEPKLSINTSEFEDNSDLKTGTTDGYNWQVESGSTLNLAVTIDNGTQSFDKISFETGYESGAITVPVDVKIRPGGIGSGETPTTVKENWQFESDPTININEYQVPDGYSQLTVELVPQSTDGSSDAVEIRYHSQTSQDYINFEGYSAPTNGAAFVDLGAPPAKDVSLSDGNGEIRTFGDFMPSESNTYQLSELDTGSSELNWTRSSGEFEYRLQYTTKTETVDPVVELNGDPSQQVAVDGSLGEGQTVIKQIDNSWLESGDNTATVTLNNSSLPAGSPPMEARVSVEKPAKSARYVSASYTNLSRSNGVGVDWSGSGTLDVTVQGWTGSSWEDARQLSTSQTGDVVLDYAPIDYEQTRVEIVANDNVEIRDESIQFFTSTPEIDEGSATPASGDSVSNSPVQLSIAVSDADFDTSQGDTVTVEFRDAADDTVIGTDTIPSNGTATTSWDGVIGQNSWYVVATDEYNNSVTSSTFTFETPNQITFREESNPQTLVTNASATVRFFTVDGDVAVERPIENGSVNMTGLPNTEFVVFAQSPNHYDRTIYLNSIFEQQSAFLLNETKHPRDQNDAVRSRFIYEDLTGDYPRDVTTIQVERAIDLNGDNVSEYRTVAGDYWGASNEYESIFQYGVRYRIVLVNQETGARNIAGAHIPTEELTQTIRVSGLAIEAQNASGVVGLAELNETAETIEIAYNDPDATTDELAVTVQSRGGDDVLYTETVDGPIGTYTQTVPLNASQASEEWVVEFDAGDRHRSVVPVGAGSVGIPFAVPSWVLTVLLSMGVTFIGALYGPRTAVLGAWSMVFVAAGAAMFGWAFSGVSVVVATLIAVGATLLERVFP